MTAQQVREQLLKVYEGKEAFSVSFQRLPKTLYGKYLPLTRSIVVDPGKMANEGMLMYTALHELAHHICDHDKGQEAKRPHTKLFWGIYHTLLDRAEEAGIYERSRDEAVMTLVERARAKDREAAALQRELGGVLRELWETCEARGVRPEDAMERQAGFSRKTWQALLGAANLEGQEGIGLLGQDAQERAVRLRNKDGPLRDLFAGYLAGLSMAQLDLGKEPRDADMLKKLEAERADLDRKIQRLQERLFVVTGRLLAFERGSQEEAG
jgi:hypothetical protein